MLIYCNERRGFGAEAPKPQRKVDKSRFLGRPREVGRAWAHGFGRAAASRAALRAGLRIKKNEETRIGLRGLPRWHQEAIAPRALKTN